MLGEQRSMTARSAAEAERSMAQERSSEYGPRQRREEREDLSQLFSQVTVPPLPARARVLAAVAGLWACRRYRRHGFAHAARHLASTPLRPTSVLVQDGGAVDTFLVRELCRQVRGVIRTFYGLRKCLFESVGIAAALRRCGVPAQVVVGYEVAAASQDSPVHAWVSVGEVPVSDDVAVRHRFGEIARYPQAGEGVVR